VTPKCTTSVRHFVPFYLSVQGTAPDCCKKVNIPQNKCKKFTLPLDGLDEGMRADMRMIAIAVDEHTTRLDRIEYKLDLHDA
jgi:hypothetical protein